MIDSKPNRVLSVVVSGAITLGTLVSGCGIPESISTAAWRINEPGMYKAYQQMPPMNAKQKQFVSKVHERYGPGPINPRVFKAELGSDFLHFYKSLFDSHDGFTDKDLAFMYLYSPYLMNSVP